MNKPLDDAAPAANPALDSQPSAAAGSDSGLRWSNPFAALGADFSTPLAPTPFPAGYPPYALGVSTSACALLGLDPAWLATPAALAAFSGNSVLAGCTPLASVYSGHQFGVWAGQLGDGRAILLGQAQGWEVQLKGSGPTPYSRGGDGRAVLRSSIREFLCSEAMHALGVPSTRALCLVGVDAPVRRESLETAAVVTRLAPSFIRFGHFEHFSARGQTGPLRTLADHVIAHYYPSCQPGGQACAAAGGNPYAALLGAVGERTALLLAQWQAQGFCHGVMNTDNMSILGLTIDYGPFQFLDGFDPQHVCNHSDQLGRYAFGQQPSVAYWNLRCLAQALLPLIGEPALALAALEPYKSSFSAYFLGCMRAKLGLLDVQDNDAELVQATLQLLAREKTDYSIFWRRLSQQAAGAPRQHLRELFMDTAAFDAWMLEYSERTSFMDKAKTSHMMLKTNPKFVLRNHLGEQVIQQALGKNFSALADLQRLLQAPYDEHPGFDASASIPPEWASSIAISCSS